MIDLESALRLADEAETLKTDWLDLDISDQKFFAECRTRISPLASTVRGLVERVRESPAWHKRPTGPGIWVCEPDGGERSAGMGYSILDLDQQALDEGAPHYTARVFGPIMGCEVPVYPNRPRRSPEESPNA